VPGRLWSRGRDQDCLRDAWPARLIRLTSCPPARRLPRHGSGRDWISRGRRRSARHGKRCGPGTSRWAPVPPPRTGRSSARPATGCTTAKDRPGRLSAREARRTQPARIGPRRDELGTFATLISRFAHFPPGYEEALRVLGEGPMVEAPAPGTGQGPTGLGLRRRDLVNADAVRRS